MITMTNVAIAFCLSVPIPQSMLMFEKYYGNVCSFSSREDSGV